ncbi:MAG: PleD family two-component system response regulator [Promethearchaeota archaeon]
MANLSKIILVVDDDPYSLKLMRVILEKKSYTIWGASDGSEALELVSQNPDLVLMDIRLPYTTGFDICKQIKDNTLTKHIPVILYSSLITDEQFEEGMKVGVDAFLTKPFTSEELIQFVNRFLSSQGN